LTSRRARRPSPPAAAAQQLERGQRGAALRTWIAPRNAGSAAGDARSAVTRAPRTATGCVAAFGQVAVVVADREQRAPICRARRAATAADRDRRNRRRPARMIPPFRTDRFARAAEVVDVIDRDPGDHRDVGIDDVDRVEPAAETDLEHQRIELRAANIHSAASVPNSK
jgi:hypothetical protein